MALLPSPVPDIPAIAKRLKLSTAQKKRLMQCTLPPERLDCLKTGDWAHALYGAESMAVIDAAMLLAASGDLPRQSLKRLLKFEAMWTPPVFPLGGDNLLELGLKPGPIFGALLREVEQWWIGKDFKPNRQQCFAELKSVWFERKRVNR
jgi:poly(A) polymerase